MYNNFNGLLAYQYNEDNAKVAIEDVISKNIEEYGMYLTGTGITVNNANIKNSAGGLVIGNNFENEITLAGDVSITNKMDSLLYLLLKVQCVLPETSFQIVT